MPRAVLRRCLVPVREAVSACGGTTDDASNERVLERATDGDRCKSRTARRSLAAAAWIDE